MKRFILETKVYGWAIIYTILTILLHWRFNFAFDIGAFIVGAVIGLHLLEIIEALLNLPKSPFRTVIAQGLVTLLTIFVLTSSRLYIGKSVVLLLNLRYIYLQQDEYKRQKSLEKWFSGITDRIQPRSYLIILYIIFLFETLLFIIT